MEQETEQLTMLEQAKIKQKQLHEALQLLDRVGGDIDWALDFSNYESINERLRPLSYAISQAHEEIEEDLDRLIEAIDSYNDERDIALNEVDFSTDLKHYLD